MLDLLSAMMLDGGNNIVRTFLEDRLLLRLMSWKQMAAAEC